MKDKKVRRKLAWYKQQRKVHMGITDAELMARWKAKLEKEAEVVAEAEAKKKESEEVAKKAKENVELKALEKEVVTEVAKTETAVVSDPVVVGTEAVVESLAPNTPAQ